MKSKRSQRCVSFVFIELRLTIKCNSICLWTFFGRSFINFMRIKLNLSWSFLIRLFELYVPVVSLRSVHNWNIELFSFVGLMQMEKVSLLTILISWSSFIWFWIRKTKFWKLFVFSFKNALVVLTFFGNDLQKVLSFFYGCF